MTMMRVPMVLIAVGLAVLNNACSVGMTTAKYPPALGPKGVTMRVQTAQGQLSGELIEVRDSGIVLADQKLRLLPYAEIVSSDVEKTSTSFSIANRTAPKPAVREHLRLLSRFPYGLTPELTQQLLSAYGQTELAGSN
jgi:hypothetical protein